MVKKSPDTKATDKINSYLEKTKTKESNDSFFFAFGRNGEIWTRDPYHPKVVRYQAALRPDRFIIIKYESNIKYCFSYLY